METRKNLPRDVFLHLLSVGTLIATAISLGIVVFQFINYYIPDVVNQFSRGSFYFGPLRGALATLIIVFPVYVWTLSFLHKDIKKNPEKRDLWIRRWLLYFTLFISAVVIIGDLIAVLRSYLEGELTLRFILKALTILAISGAGLFYYLEELKETPRFPKIKPIFSLIVMALVMVAVIFGFAVAGSPQNQRLVRLDERKVGDLQYIQGEVIRFWQTKDILPANLDELKDEVLSVTIPRDPETGESYRYEVTGNLTFKLCAEFKASNRETKDGNGNTKSLAPVDPYWDQNQNWLHDAETTCFDRTIDPERLKLNPARPL